jgi:hypothetical protein
MMSASKKLVLLSLTLWPLVYVIYAILFFWNLSLVALTQLPLAVIIIHIVTMIILLAIVIVYSLHLYSNSAIDDQSKLMWFIGFIFLGVFVTIVYWKKYVW